MINQTAPDTTDEVEELLSDGQLTNEQLTEIKKKSVSGVVSYFVRTVFLQSIGLVAAFVLSAYFSPEDFAVYGFVTQIIGLLIFFSDIGLAAALVQKKKEPSLQDYRTVFTLQQLLSWLVVLVVMLLISSGVVSNKYGQVGNWILLSLGLSFPLATLKTIPSLMLERKLDFNKLVLPQIFEQIVFQGLLIFLAWKQLGVMAYTYAILSRSVIGVIVMWIIQPWKIGFAWNKTSLKTLLGYGIKFQLNDFLARIKDQLFYLLLAWYLPVKDFGYLSWAKNWSMYPYNLTVQNVMSVTFPTFSRLQKNKQALKRAIEKSLFFISLFIFPLLAGMSLFIFPLTNVIDKYHKWQPSMFSFVLFALSIGWAAISTPLVNTLNAIGHIDKSLKLMGMWTVLTWVLTPLAVWKFGFNGVAIASFAISFTSVFAVFFVKKIIDVSVWENVWRQLVATLIMVGAGIAGMNWWSESFSNMIIGVAVVSIVYLLSILLVGGKKLFFEAKSLAKFRK